MARGGDRASFEIERAARNAARFCDRRARTLRI
jgi:hypothetical protein